MPFRHEVVAEVFEMFGGVERAKEWLANASKEEIKTVFNVLRNRPAVEPEGDQP